MKPPSKNTFSQRPTAKQAVDLYWKNQKYMHIMRVYLAGMADDGDPDEVQLSKQ